MLAINRFIIALLFVPFCSGCSGPGHAPATSPSTRADATPKASASAQASASSQPAPSDGSSDPQYSASGEVKLNKKTFALRSAVAIYSQPHKLDIYLTDGPLSPEKAATLASIHSDKLGKAVRECGTLDAKFYVVFKENEPGRAAKDVTFLMLAGMDGNASVSALPSVPLSASNPASNFISIEHLNQKGPGRVKLQIRNLDLGGDCGASFSVDCPILGR